MYYSISSETPPGPNPPSLLHMISRPPALQPIYKTNPEKNQKKEKNLPLMEVLRGSRKKRGYNYNRLHGLGRKRKIPEVTLGGGGQKKRSWRFKIRSKLKFLRLGSPKKFIIKLRDAYVNMMLGFSRSRVCSSGYAGYGLGSAGYGCRPMKEYDEKMLVELYKKILMVQAQSSQGQQIVHHRHSAGGAAANSSNTTSDNKFASKLVAIREEI